MSVKGIRWSREGQGICREEMEGKLMKKIDAYLSYIKKSISDKYAVSTVSQIDCFYNPSTNEYFYIDKFEFYNAIFASYASGAADAKNNIFEDGDLHYVEDMTKEQMLEEIIQEIER